MKIRTREQTATVAHPRDPLLRVKGRRLKAAEQLQLREDQAKLAVKKATIGPDGQVIRTQDASGNWRVDSERIVPFTVDLTLKSMRLVIVNVEGLEDEDGTPIAFDPKNPDPVLLLLFEEELSVPDVPVLDEKGVQKKNQDTGEPLTFTQGFGWWLLDEFSKKETFSPLTPSSPPSSTVSSDGEQSTAPNA